MPSYCPDFKSGMLVGIFVSFGIFVIIEFFGEEIVKWVRKVF